LDDSWLAAGGARLIRATHRMPRLLCTSTQMRAAASTLLMVAQVQQVQRIA
jgi:hypothetical protein